MPRTHPIGAARSICEPPKPEPDLPAVPIRLPLRVLGPFRSEPPVHYVDQQEVRVDGSSNMEQPPLSAGSLGVSVGWRWVRSVAACSSPWRSSSLPLRNLGLPCPCTCWPRHHGRRPVVGGDRADAPSGLRNRRRRRRCDSDRPGDGLGDAPCRSTTAPHWCSGPAPGRCRRLGEGCARARSA